MSIIAIVLFVIMGMVLLALTLIQMDIIRFVGDCPSCDEPTIHFAENTGQMETCESCGTDILISPDGSELTVASDE